VTAERAVGAREWVTAERTAGVRAALQALDDAARAALAQFADSERAGAGELPRAPGEREVGGDPGAEGGEVARREPGGAVRSRVKARARARLPEPGCWAGR